MKKYAITYSVSYALLTIALFAVAMVLDFGGSGMSIAATIAASFIAAGSFVKNEQREATPEERSRFAWGALAATFVISLVLVVVATTILPSEANLASISSLFMSGAALGGVAIAMLVISAIYYFVIRWAFGWYSAKAAK